MRFKPPPPNSEIGWRVEFRPMEVQLTDFENSAYVVFIVLLTRVILSYKLDFLIPLSKVDENMKVAQKRNAVQEGMFYFRKDVFKGCTPVLDRPGAAQNGLETETNDGEEFILMSIDTIINGKEGVFHGLIPMLNSYLENMEVDVDTRCTILNYLKLIKKRASGDLMTMAKWMREFVAKHPQYKQDSVITDKINYDLLHKCDRIAKGEEKCPELIGEPVNRGK
nr:Gclc protein [Danio rerio]